MSDNRNDSTSANGTAGARRQESAAASSAMSASYAEVMGDVRHGAVRQLFGAPAQAAGGGTPAARPAEGPSVASSALATPFGQAIDQVASRPHGAGAPDPALTGTGFSYRHDWGPRRGQWTLRLNWGSVNPRSRVLVAISEGMAGGPDNGKFIGAARYTVHNVAPRAGGVDIWVNIEWSADILLYADYLVINP